MVWEFIKNNKRSLLILASILFTLAAKLIADVYNRPFGADMIGASFFLVIFCTFMIFPPETKDPFAEFDRKAKRKVMQNKKQNSVIDIEF